MSSIMTTASSHINDIMMITIILYISSSYAVVIPISNAGFEDDGPLSDNTFFYDSNGLPSWTNWDLDSLMDESVGVQNTVGGDSFNDPILSDSPPQGGVSAYVEQTEPSYDAWGEVGIQQKLTGYLVEADTIYTLTAYVGNPASNCWSAASSDPSACFTPVGFPGYRVQLLGQNSLLAEDDDSLTIQEGEWAKSTVVVTIEAGDTNIGKTLKIRLVNKNGASGGIEVGFDDIQLTAVATSAITSASPTKQPTSFPTLSPTKAPTRHPTKQPIAILPPTSSLIGTVLPTLTPNEDATNYPSNYPTNYPTNVASNRPSFGPTTTEMETTTISPLMETSERLSTTHSEKDTTKRNKDSNVIEAEGIQVWKPYMTVAAGAIAMFLGCLCVCMFYFCYKARREDDEEKQLVDDIELDRDADDDKVQEEKNELDAIDKAELRAFFKNDLQLPQYYDTFVQNGYDSIPAMLAVTKKEQLVDIGVTMAGHIALILMKAQRLKNSTEGGASAASTEVDTWQRQFASKSKVTYEECENERNENMEYEKVDDEMLAERRRIKAWFDEVVQLPKYKYHEVFIEKGYETMKAIQTIKSKPEIKDIGVRILGHQTLILSEIEKLRSNQLIQAPQMMQMYQNMQNMQNMQMNQNMQMMEQQQIMPMHEGNGDYSEAPPGMNQVNGDYGVHRIIQQQNERILQLQDDIDEAHDNIDQFEATVGNEMVPESLKEATIL